MKKFLLAGVAAAALFSAPALAADYPVKGPVDPMWSWTGFYIGGNLGSIGINSNQVTGCPAGTCNNPSGSDWAYGGQLGANVQWGSLVLGVETSGDWTKLMANNPCFNPTFRCDLGLNHQYDVRGRVGLAMNNVLLYGTGGKAWSDPHGFTQIIATGVMFPGGTHRSGTVWGGGAEFAMAGNWIVGAEYLHTNFGTQSHTYDAVYTVPVQTWEARARLSYLFNWR
jgi:outer membrane immunogenic protein